MMAHSENQSKGWAIHFGIVLFTLSVVMSTYAIQRLARSADLSESSVPQSCRAVNDPRAKFGRDRLRLLRDIDFQPSRASGTGH